MRRTFSFLVLMTVVATTHLLAQGDPIARARQQEAEEHQQRMNARLQALEESLQAIQQEMTALRGEVRNLRDQASRSNPASQGAMQQLEDKIREVDKKRVADQEKVLAEFARLQKNLGGSPAPTRPTNPKTGNTKGDKTDKTDKGDKGDKGDKTDKTATAATPGKTYEYTIREGDVLSKIVRDLREQGLNINEAAVKKANPKVDWNNLKIGKTIIIPVPEK
jgi:hypothetical protein